MQLALRFHNKLIKSINSIMLNFQENLKNNKFPNIHIKHVNGEEQI